MKVQYRVYSPEGNRIASCEDSAAAALLMSLYGDGTTIRVGRQIVWTEGEEIQPGAESYDYVYALIWTRIEIGRALKIG